MLQTVGKFRGSGRNGSRPGQTWVHLRWNYKESQVQFIKPEFYGNYTKNWVHTLQKIHHASITKIQVGNDWFLIPIITRYTNTRESQIQSSIFWRVRGETLFHAITVSLIGLFRYFRIIYQSINVEDRYSFLPPLKFARQEARSAVVLLGWVAWRAAQSASHAYTASLSSGFCEVTLALNSAHNTGDRDVETSWWDNICGQTGSGVNSSTL